MQRRDKRECSPNVGQEPQIAQWLLRTAHLPLFLAQFVREGDQELAIPFPLCTGEGEDACEVVASVTIFVFGEISNRMEASFIMGAYSDIDHIEGCHGRM